jgi:glutamate formiminotransferase
MDRIVECVPNFSEGRRKEVVERILGEAKAVRGVKLLDCAMDPDHNRTVVTLAGEPEACAEAAFRACRKAAELIDMDSHKGEHSRVGATDVIPFVPVRGVTMQDCVALARRVGKRIGEELGIPVYLYEEAATCPERRNLADVRKGQYEGLKAEMHLPHRKPDFGPAKLGKAGATVVGARPFLVAFNVNLGTRDVSVAKDIAKKIREKDGGFKCVKAMGFNIADRGFVQVSMNLVNYKVTSPRTIFDAITREAEARGVKVLESELIGVAPQDAIPPGDEVYLKIAGFSKDQIIENRI